MDIQTQKLQLVKRILEINSQELIDKLFNALDKEDTDFWHDLSNEQKRQIDVSRKQVKNGETEDWESVYNRLK